MKWRSPEPRVPLLLVPWIKQRYKGPGTRKAKLAAL